MEYAKIKMTNALLMILSNQNADELINELSEWVVILNETLNEVLFTNREATKKLRVIEGGDLKYAFDASSINAGNDRSIDMQEPVFGWIESLEPKGIDYNGFIKDMNSVRLNLSLKDII